MPDDYVPTPYEDLLREVSRRGQSHANRTSKTATQLFGAQIRYDLAAGFPLITTKRVPFVTVAIELLWFLKGRTDVQWLQERGVTIWDEWATAEKCAKFGREPGDLGPIYGYAWRHFGGEYPSRDRDDASGGFDQIARLLRDLKANPASRRHILTGWDPKEADNVSLPPCHTLAQFHVEGDRLSCQLYQRSADLLLGVPFNIASYALLTHMVAQVTGLGVGEFVHTFGNAHIYDDHHEQVALQLSRKPFPYPRVVVAPEVTSLDQLDAVRDPQTGKWTVPGITLVGYQSHPGIKAEVAV